MRFTNKLALALIGLSIVSVPVLMVKCVSIPSTIAPVLAEWAARKAERLAHCVADGKRGSDLLGCLGGYARDRGTYACERVRVALEGE